MKNALSLLAWIALATLLGLAGEPLARALSVDPSRPDAWAMGSLLAFCSILVGKIVWVLWTLDDSGLAETANEDSGTGDALGVAVAGLMLLPISGSLNIVMAAFLGRL